MPLNWGKVNKDLLEPQFVSDIEAMFAESPYLWLVSEGLRSLQRSKELNDAFVAGKGPRAAPPGKSAHNFGLAIDVMLDGDPKKPGVQPTWDTKAAGWVWLKAKTAAHPRLKGGWRFSDWPHIERFKWELYKNWSSAGGA